MSFSQSSIFFFIVNPIKRPRTTGSEGGWQLCSALRRRRHSRVCELDHVEWNSLSINRYDVRHLLPSPLPPRLERCPIHQPDVAASPLEADLDYERYLDLPSSSSNEQEQCNIIVVWVKVM